MAVGRSLADAIDHHAERRANALPVAAWTSHRMPNGRTVYMPGYCREGYLSEAPELIPNGYAHDDPNKALDDAARWLGRNKIA